ncbi:MAG: hypothetical protein U0930_25235 [Pirellulales bacterium]
MDILRQPQTPVTNGKDKGITAAQKFLKKAGVKFPIEGPDNGPWWRDSNHGGNVQVSDSPLGGCRIQTYWPFEPENWKAH